MAGILKNQILKHLSKFVKNLSADRINLSTLKGEGELQGLELEEELLTELLALPSWMKLTAAVCNRAAIRIQWTKLKTTPICLTLDEVRISIEASDELRPLSNLPAMYTNTGKYGFVNKVIDGITAIVNSVEITFHSKEFEAKVQISRIRVESRNPQWGKDDLPRTRLKDGERGEVLVFKEMEWQTLRLEARATADRHLAPLRLLTNTARARIVLKKRLLDCSVIACRLTLLLDDLLWVLTDSQILAAASFAASLADLIKEATEMSQRVKAARKLESLPVDSSRMGIAGRGMRTPSGRTFDTFDVLETSYHFECEKIDLHFCDDPGKGRSSHVDLRDGAALQLSLIGSSVDFYPYHVSKGGRSGWRRTAETSPAAWISSALSSFRVALLEAVSPTSLHSPLARTPAVHAENPVRSNIADQLGKLMCTVLIVSVRDVKLFKVTTSSKREPPAPFLAGYMEKPADLPTIHSEFTWFYYPGEVFFPLPSPKAFIVVNPVEVHLDLCTLLWLNCFAANLGDGAKSSQEPSPYMDVRLQLIMPKIVFEGHGEYVGQKERPQTIHFHVSKLTVSNVRGIETGTLNELAGTLEALQGGDLVFGAGFPARPTDLPLIPQKFVIHAEGRDNLREIPNVKGNSFAAISPILKKDLLWTEPRDVWFIGVDSFWAEFRLQRKGKDGRNPTLLYPFIDSIPLQLWIISPEKKAGGSKEIRVLCKIVNSVSIQLTHSQFLFLCRMIEAMGELSLFLNLDLAAVLGSAIENNLLTAVGILPAIEISFLFPPKDPDSPEEEPSQEEPSPQHHHHEDEESVHGSPLIPQPEGLREIQNRDCIRLATPDSEVSSMWSNFSSDSSEAAFIYIEPAVEGMNNGNEPVEIGTEATGEEIIEPRIHRVDSDAQVGVFLVRIEEVEFGVEVLGRRTIGKVEASVLDIKDCGPMSWNEFQGKFSSVVSSEKPFASHSHGKDLKVRFNQESDLEGFRSEMEKLEEKISLARRGPNPRLNLTDLPGESSFLRIPILASSRMDLLGEVDLSRRPLHQFNLSSLAALSDLFEDEIHPVPFPFQFHVCGFKAELREDRGSRNIGCPSPPPLVLSIPGPLSVNRDAGGCLVIGEDEGPKGEEKSEGLLGAKLAAAQDSARQRGNRVRELEVEAAGLRDMVAGLQEELARLLDNLAASKRT